MDRQAKTASAHTGRSTIVLLSAIFVGALLLLAVGITYALQQRRIDTLNQKITDLTSQLAATKGQHIPITLNSPTPNDPSAYTSLKAVTIKVYSPASGGTVSSPLSIVGEVPGNWSFEASFPIKLLDSKNNVVAQTSAHLVGDWMTNKLVSFTAELTWSGVQTGSGTLVLQRDNPSGMMGDDDSVSIPISF